MKLTRAALTSRIVTISDELAALEPHWDRLLALSADATPWQCFDVVQAWWKHMGVGQLFVVVVEQATVPVLILPLQISWRRTLGLPVRTVAPIGTPDEINRPRLALGVTDPDALRAGLAALWERRREWEALQIDEHGGGEAERAALRDFASAHSLLSRQTPAAPCPFLELDRPWDEYVRSRGRHLRRNLRAARGNLESRGRLELKCARDADGLRAAYADLLAVHRASWKQAKRIGLCRSAAYQAFYAELIDRLARRREVEVRVLYCGDRPVAATLGLTAAGTYYSAHIAHDQRYADGSPGTLLESLELQQLMSAREFSRYDFMTGALVNKLRWTDTARDTVHILIARKTLRNRLIDCYYRSAKPLYKEWRRGLRSNCPR